MLETNLQFAFGTISSVCCVEKNMDFEVMLFWVWSLSPGLYGMPENTASQI